MQYNQGQPSGSGSNGQGQGQAQGQGQGGEKNGPRPLRAPAPGPLNIGYSNHQQGMSQMPQYQFQNQGQNQNQGQSQPNQNQYGGNVGYPTNYPAPGPPRRPSGGNEISPFQTTGTSLPSGSANSSPINQFNYQHQQPPYINIDRTEPMGARPLPMIPSEPRMGHYSNYQTYPQPQQQHQHQGYDQWHPGQNQNQGQGQGNEQISQSRRSTISNASDHNISRPTTSDALKVKDMVKIEPAMEEEEDEEKLDHRKRKRNRTIRSCVPCHNHKRKVGHPFRSWGLGLMVV